MSIHCFLAMTATEFSNAASLPPYTAWMACHFSNYGTGLQDLPQAVPPGSMVILNDRIPPRGHDTQQILQELTTLTKKMEISGFLLDFQRENCPETQAIARQLVASSPVPIGVSALYAKELDCPVFLDPPPLCRPYSAHIMPWKGREIWLDAAIESGVLHISQDGTQYQPLPYFSDPKPLFCAKPLFCHYSIQVSDRSADFTFHRQPEDIDELLLHAREMGITRAIGLYQQFQP